MEGKWAHHPVYSSVNSLGPGISLWFHICFEHLSLGALQCDTDPSLCLSLLVGLCSLRRGHRVCCPSKPQLVFWFWQTKFQIFFPPALVGGHKGFQKGDQLFSNIWGWNFFGCRLGIVAMKGNHFKTFLEVWNSCICSDFTTLWAFILKLSCCTTGWPLEIFYWFLLKLGASAQHRSLQSLKQDDAALCVGFLPSTPLWVKQTNKARACCSCRL